jgi:hypothetical protein
MATVPVSAQNRKAFRATICDEPGVLGVVDSTIYFFRDSGDIIEFEPEMAPWTCILGEVGLSEAQALADRRHGGASWIATHRDQEVA